MEKEVLAVEDALNALDVTKLDHDALEQRIRVNIFKLITTDPRKISSKTLLDLILELQSDLNILEST